MFHMPQVKSWNLVGSAPLGPSHTVKRFDSIRAAGSIQYAYLVGVFDNASDEPVHFVASAEGKAGNAGVDGDSSSRRQDLKNAAHPRIISPQMAVPWGWQVER